MKSNSIWFFSNTSKTMNSVEFKSIRCEEKRSARAKRPATLLLKGKKINVRLYNGTKRNVLFSVCYFRIKQKKSCWKLVEARRRVGTAFWRGTTFIVKPWRIFPLKSAFQFGIVFEKLYSVTFNWVWRRPTRITIKLSNGSIKPKLNNRYGEHLFNSPQNDIIVNFH